MISESGPERGLNRKRILAAALLTLALPSVKPYAIEIPEDASYENGVSMLHESAEKDLHEVAAIYVCSGDKCAWFSKDGGGKSVDLRSVAKQAAAFLKEHRGSQTETEEKQMQIFHTHPQKVIQKFMVDRYQKHFNFQFKDFSSLPPSAGDIVSIASKGAEFTLAVSDISNVDTINKVIDSSGIWTYFVTKKTKDTKQKDKNTETEEFQLGDISKYQLAWFVKSQKEPIEEMLEDGSLDKLKRVYEAFGISLDYKLFTKK